jgi:hypothetical protein
LAVALLKMKTWQEGWASVMAKDALNSSKEGVLGRRGNCNVRQNLRAGVRFLPGCKSGNVTPNGGAMIGNVGSRGEAENRRRFSIAIHKSLIANEGRR